MAVATLPNWARAYGSPALRGDLRQSPADFQVSERIPFEFSGDGEHDYLRIEKRSANTTWVARKLAEFAALRDSDVGFAGMKDRHAVTRQWFSVRRKPGQAADWRQFALPDVQVLEQTRHRKKLRRGAHSANEFRIILRNIEYLGNDLRQRLEQVRAAGVPNYFGEQRFGKNAANVQLARDAFAGMRLKRQSRSFALSAARSYLFNQVLDARVADGSWNSLLPGDCANLDGSNSIFRVADVDDELARRCRQLDLHPSGPMWGSGDLMTAGKVEQQERNIVRRHQDLADGLAGMARLSRRALRVAVQKMRWDIGDDYLQLSFALARGSYATAVLRELAEYVDCGPSAART